MPHQDEPVYTIALSATAIAPEIDVLVGSTPDVHAHDLGDVVLGDSASATFTVHNAGSADLTVSQAFASDPAVTRPSASANRW